MTVYNDIFNKRLPWYIRFLLIFKKTIVNQDVVIDDGNEYKTVVYAKYLRGVIYIIKTEQFINGKPALIS